jgi:hypothetical protein
MRENRNAVNKKMQYEIGRVNVRRDIQHNNRKNQNNPLSIMACVVMLGPII